MTDGASGPLMGSVKYREGLDPARVLNRSLNVFFKDALRVALTNPSQAYHFLRTAGWQKTAARTRSKWERKGLHVPPMLIFSITNRCNLHCKGCYNWALRPQLGMELDGAKLQSVIGEAKELGISFVMIAGGEPLVRPEILRHYPGFSTDNLSGLHQRPLDHRRGGCATGRTKELRSRNQHRGATARHR